MCHIEQSPRRIPLYTHILRFRQPRQRTQRARLRNPRLILLMRSQIRDTSHSITLDLDILRVHLLDQRHQAVELHDLDLVLRIDGEVSERSACRSLDFCVAVLEEEEDGVEGVAADFADVALGDLGEG